MSEFKNENGKKKTETNILGLAPESTKMDAIRAYSHLKTETESKIKQGNITEEEIKEAEERLVAGREECLRILNMYDTSDECCENEECCEGNNCCESNECECCNEQCCENNECECCENNECEEDEECCKSDECLENYEEPQCCNEKECDCSANHCSKFDNFIPNTIANDEHTLSLNNNFSNQYEEFPDNVSYSSKYPPEYNCENTPYIINEELTNNTELQCEVAQENESLLKITNENNLKNQNQAFIVEDVDDKSAGWCGIKWFFCF